MNVKLISVLAAGLLSAAPAFSSTVTLDFEGATSFSSVGNFYNGGKDGGGASGPNYGVSFGGDALAISNDDATTFFTHAPTPGTVMTAVGTDAALNAYALIDQVSFYYSSSQATSVSIYSGLNGGGALLGTFSLAANATNGCSDSPFCHWDLATLSFAGIAQSIQFGTTWNATDGSLAGFDNITVNAVPLPAAVWLILSGLGGLGFMRRKRSV